LNDQGNILNKKKYKERGHPLMVIGVGPPSREIRVRYLELIKLMGNANKVLWQDL
jgi:hypothetical protein